jgi:hypothetical protein
MANINEQSYYPKDKTEKTSSYAIISLISGVLGWLGIFGLGGILAVIFGHLAKKEIRDSLGSVTGDGLATVGLILGYTNIALTLIGLCFLALMLLGILSVPLLCVPFSNGFNFDFSSIP